MWRWRATAFVPSYTLMTVRNKSSTPIPVLKDVGTIGTPNSICSVSMLRASPRCSNSSYMFRAHTIGRCMSTSCVVRYRLRSRFDESRTLMMTSGCFSSRCSRT